MILARLALEAALVRSLRALPKTQTYKLQNWSPSQIQWLQINKRLASSIIKDTTEGAGTESAAKNLKSRVAGGVKTLPQVDEPLETAMSPSRTRALRKKRLAIDELSALGFLNTRGYTTADEYNLEDLHAALKQQNLYETKRFFSTDNLGVEQNVLFVTAKYPTGNSPERFFSFARDPWCSGTATT